MDPLKNPFSPGAGSPPPELVGRRPILEHGRILFGRIRQKRAAKSLLLTGLRGVGKTVLLNELERIAAADSYQTVSVEAHEGKPLGALLAPPLRALLYKLNRLAGMGEKLRRAWGVFRSFVGTLKLTVSEVQIGLDVAPEAGTADSGDLELDLPDLFAAVGEAAEDRKSAVAGLPILPALAGESKSYAERLFDFPEVGPLSEEDAGKAMREPAHAAGVRIEADALAEVFRVTKGYPYFVQEWGYQAWNLAAGSPIDLAVVKEAGVQAIARLDRNFFRVRFDRLTAGERRFLHAMAGLGPGPHRTGDVAQKLGVKLQSLGPVRQKMIDKGMIYSPAHGELAFTVPLFDEFMTRAMPERPV